MIRCGIYLRLSREDGLEESNSIQNQRLLIHQYISGNEDMVLSGEWVDDGWSGSRFDRPGFQSMMEAVLNGRIDCILVKDLSRLGREYIQTGRYLQEIFPKLGIRFIAIADHYDSAETEFMEQSLMMPVLNLMNDAYCRDISQKVRWQQQTKRQMGEYIGAFAVYGYQKDRNNIHRLVIDEKVEEIIWGIYRLRLSGMAAEKIAERLNRQKIPSPREYKRQQGSKFRSGFDLQSGDGQNSETAGDGGKERHRTTWSPLAVRRILHNKMYTGVMVQGKDRKISYKLNIRKKLPQEEWVCIENKVPVLIPLWIFERIKRLEQKRIRCEKGRSFCGLWSGILNCRLGEAGVEEEKLLSFLCRKYLGGEVPTEEWMRRLFLVLFFERIEVFADQKIIVVYLVPEM